MKLIDPETLRIQTDNYFAQVEKFGQFQLGEIVYKEPEPTITGLALFLGIRHKRKLKEYLEDPEYADAVSYALLRLENQYEKLAQRGVANAKIGLRWFDADWEERSTVNTNFTFADMVKRANN